MVNQWRQKIAENLIHVLGSSQASAIILGLTIGDRALISAHTSLVFQDTGTSHLLAISGLHVSLLATMCFFLMKQLWGLCANLCLLLPAQKAAAALTLLLAFFYLSMSGFSISAVRAYIMLAVLMLYIICDRKIHAWHALKIALWIVLLLLPFSVLNAGFWLSFVAVAIILVVVANRLSSAKKWRQALSLQFAIVFAMLPLTMFYFHKAVLLAPLVNLFAIPWLGLTILPVALCSVVILCFNHVLVYPLLWLVSKNISCFLFVLSFFAHLKSLIIPVGINQLWVFLFANFAVFLLIMPRGFPGKLFSPFFLLPLFFVRTTVADNQFKFTLLDVGQGLASLVQTQHYALLYDAGPRYSKTSDAGAVIINPYLHQQGISHLNALVLSHFDLDHIGGLSSVLEVFPAQHIYAYSKPRNKLAKKAYVRCQQQAWRWDGVSFRIFSVRGMRESNNRACVLKVCVKTYCVLSTGDIEKKFEVALVDHYRGALQSTVLIVPHHGSRTSSTYSFLRFVSPRWALIPAGYQNRFHFPAKTIINRYHFLGIKTINVARYGAIDFTVSALGVGEMHYYRLQSQRIWRR